MYYVCYVQNWIIGGSIFRRIAVGTKFMSMPMSEYSVKAVSSNIVQGVSPNLLPCTPGSF